MRAEDEKLGNRGEIAHDQGDYRGRCDDGKAISKRLRNKGDIVS